MTTSLVSPFTSRLVPISAAERAAAREREADRWTAGRWRRPHGLRRGSVIVRSSYAVRRENYFFVRAFAARTDVAGFLVARCARPAVLVAGIGSIAWELASLAVAVLADLSAVGTVLVVGQGLAFGALGVLQLRAGRA